VPLEWNALFIYITAFLFLGDANWKGYEVGDMDPVLLGVTLAGLLLFPVLGNLRPDLVSFLSSMRRYAGGWASAMWALAPGAEATLDARLVKGAPMQKAQLSEIYAFDRERSARYCWQTRTNGRSGIFSFATMRSVAASDPAGTCAYA